MPTFAEQLHAAALLLEREGPKALNNPHAMIGRMCGCNDCFCCAALKIYKAYQKTRETQGSA